MSTPENKPVWQDAWRVFQDPYLYPDNEEFPSPFVSFVAGYLAARTVALEQAEKIALSMVDNEPDGYYGQACVEVAGAIRAAKEETP